MAVKGTQKSLGYIAGEKGSADFGHRSSRRKTGKVIYTPTWRIAKSSAAVVHIAFFVENGRWMEKIGEQFNSMDENEWDHMHPMSGTGDHQPR